MIEAGAEHAGRAVQHWVLRPNQSLAPRQILAFLLLAATVSAAVAGFSWLHGNVFAPLFAVLELSVLALVFRYVWKRSARAEVIRLGPKGVSVSRLPGSGLQFEVHPSWVRIEADRRSLLLVSGAQRVTVGAFLGEAERELLRKDLECGLRLARTQGS